VLYHDGQFDDARYIVALLRTFQELGGTAINYVEATGLLHRNGKTVGVQARDAEGDALLDLQAKVVVNATGVFSEDVLAMDGAARGSLLAMSQGTHFVLPHSFLPGDAALMVPKTADGRVLFAIPWHGATLVGTTDEAVDRASAEPRSMKTERSFLFEHIDRYFGRRPKAEEILSVWSGLRPLVRKGHGKTSKLSRDHTILVSKSGIVTVTGGKWTTYRRMGQDAIDQAAEVAGLPRIASRTLDLKLHGWTDQVASVAESDRVYGADLPMIQQLSAEDPGLEKLLHPRLPYRLREVVWAARHEMARTVEDVLARRTRALFLDARAAIEAAPLVADVLAKELGRNAAWRERDLHSFLTVAQSYVYLGE
jgi:glycerol-3-phosphate dehydrogenase